MTGTEATRRFRLDDRTEPRLDYRDVVRRLLSRVTELSTTNTTNRGVWRRVDELRAARSHAASWPEWCFLPELTLAVLAKEFPAIASHLATFQALASWRATQGIYVFDDLLLQHLFGTDTDDPIPAEVLLRLPEWGVYITASQGLLMEWGLNGFFAFLSYDESQSQPALNFILDMGKEGLQNTFALPLHNGSVRKAIEDSRDSCVQVLSGAGRYTEAAKLSELDLGEYRRLFHQLVSLVLYLCCSNAEIRSPEGECAGVCRPRPRKTRKGLRLFPADRPKVLQVGFLLGTFLRKQAHRNGGEPEPTSGAVRIPPCPHVRRAHWHSFWVGSVSQPESRTVRLKWLPPVLVNGQRSDLRPAIRKMSAATRQT